MANLARLRVELGGAGVVGPGVMTFYNANSGSGLPTAVKSFLTSLQSTFPDDVTLTVPNTGDLIDEATGALAGAWTDGTAGVITGSGTGAFQVGAGIRVKWLTGGIVNGRRVRGSTFIVPAVSLAFDTSGRLGSTTVSVVTTAANALIAAQGSYFRIWSRPVPGRAGTSHEVTSCSVPLTGTSLRSRRT